MKTIIIVDDSKVFQSVVEKILRPYFKVIGKGASGNEAFDLYQKNKPDIIFMDITMPNSSGIEGLRKIIDFDRNA
jgi:two-component system chemotaxis response regulator CheY